MVLVQIMLWYMYSSCRHIPEYLKTKINDLMFRTNSVVCFVNHNNIDLTIHTHIQTLHLIKNSSLYNWLTFYNTLTFDN